jgi:hypothetical protein
VVGRRVGDAGDEADDEEAAVPRHAPADLVEGVAAHRVVGHVHPATGRGPDGVHPVRRLVVVDHDVGAEVPAELHLRLTTGDGHHLGPGRSPELDGGGPGAAGSPGDQQPLARLDLRPVVQGEPRGPVVDRDRRPTPRGVRDASGMLSFYINPFSCFLSYRFSYNYHLILPS